MPENRVKYFFSTGACPCDYLAVLFLFQESAPVFCNKSCIPLLLPYVTGKTPKSHSRVSRGIRQEPSFLCIIRITGLFFFFKNPIPEIRLTYPRQVSG
jgi:hypothetical protein